MLIGKGRDRFIVHTAVICARSDFFQAACERWKKSKEPVELLEDAPDTFNAYLSCLYMGKLPPSAGQTPHFAPMLAIYVLADRICDLQTANFVIDGIIAHSNAWGQLPSFDVVDIFWSQTAPDSPLRRLLVDFIVYEADEEEFDDRLQDLPADYLTKVARRLKSMTEGAKKTKGMIKAPKSLSDMLPCHYHQRNSWHARVTR